MTTPRALTTFALLLLCGGTSQAQFSSDPALNLALADGASDQVQPKLEATVDGGAWLSWFDGIANGFDVRVQRIDQDGQELLPHVGVLVADRSFSSTQDYGLSMDAGGDALLAFRDDRLVGTQISAARIAADGTASWGVLGVQLTNTSAFVAAPKIAGTADGGAVVAWTQDSSTHLQRLDATGAPQWAGDVVLTPGAGSFSVADLHAAGNDVILSMVHQTGGFSSPKRLVAQKLDAGGAELWAAGGLTLFDTSSLQFGSFPSFVPDGDGGAVFSWYTTSPLQCYAQHVLMDGTEAFPHGGSAVSANTTRIRVDPSASYDPVGGYTLVSWVEENALQSQFGLASQKFDAVGGRLWGVQGTFQIGLGPVPISLVRILSSADTGWLFWSEAPGFGQDQLFGRRLLADGSTDVGPLDVASTPSDKSRLAVAMGSTGQALLAWSDARTDAGDVYAQNVHCDGSLGPADTTSPWSDLGNGLAGVAGVPLLTGQGSLCPGDLFSVELSSANPASSATLVLGLSALFAPLKGGVLVPNADVLFFGLSTDGAGALSLPAVWPVGLPSQLPFWLQYWVADGSSPHGFSASNGLLGQVP